MGKSLCLWPSTPISAMGLLALPTGAEGKCSRGVKCHIIMLGI